MIRIPILKDVTEQVLSGVKEVRAGEELNV